MTAFGDIPLSRDLSTSNDVDSSGTITASSRSSVPTGWLLCDGSAVSRATYANLFSAIGTSFGVGDGSTTFNLPDLLGRAPVGLGTHADVNALGDSDGLAAGSRTPAHTHTFPTSGGPTSNTAVTAYPDPGGAVPRTATSSGHTHTFGTSGSTKPPYIAINYLIKT